MIHSYIKITPLSIFPELDSVKLFGAIFSAISELYPQDEKERFREDAENADVKISSAFPVIDDIFFFPKPVITIEENLIDEEKLGKEKAIAIERSNLVKKFEKVRYVSKSVFEDITKRCVLDKELLEKIENKELILDEHGVYLCTDEENEKLPKIEGAEMPKVSVERITEKSRIYHEGGNYHKLNNIYFFVMADNKNFELIETAIRFLSDRGFGPNYSSGFGQFECCGINKVKIKEIGGRFLTLSKYLPRNEEINEMGKGSFYKVKEVKGLTRIGMHIPPIFLFTEGSCFEFKREIEPKGKLHEIEEANYLLNGIMYSLKVA